MAGVTWFLKTPRPWRWIFSGGGGLMKTRLASRPTVRSRCALLRDPTEQLQESDEIRTLAEDYLRAVASQNRLTLLRWCLAQEGMDAQTLSAFLPAVQHRLVHLLAEPDETVLPQALCAQQLRLLETCERYRRANVGTKHIFGLLSVSGVQAKVQK